jgi:hypothetical protein
MLGEMMTNKPLLEGMRGLKLKNTPHLNNELGAWYEFAREMHASRALYMPMARIKRMKDTLAPGSMMICVFFALKTYGQLRRITAPHVRA